MNTEDGNKQTDEIHIESLFGFKPREVGHHYISHLIATETEQLPEYANWIFTGTHEKSVLIIITEDGSSSYRNYYDWLASVRVNFIIACDDSKDHKICYYIFRPLANKDFTVIKKRIFDVNKAKKNLSKLRGELSFVTSNYALMYGLPIPPAIKASFEYKINKAKTELEMANSYAYGIYIK